MDGGGGLSSALPCLVLLRQGALTTCRAWPPSCTACLYCLCRRMYSELISAAIATGGPHASKTTAVKLMRRWGSSSSSSASFAHGTLAAWCLLHACQFRACRVACTPCRAPDPPACPLPALRLPLCPCSVKKVTLKLIETLVDKSEDADLVAAQVRAGAGAGWGRSWEAGWGQQGVVLLRLLCACVVATVWCYNSVMLQYCNGASTAGVLRSDAPPVPPVPLPLLQYVPAMMDPILGDYARNNPDAR